MMAMTKRTVPENGQDAVGDMNDNLGNQGHTEQRDQVAQAALEASLNQFHGIVAGLDDPNV
jgi:hypothetical protein